METTVVPSEENSVKIKVTVPAKDVDAALAKTYKELASKYTFPGFRKGKAPRPVIDNAIGKDAVLAQVTEDVVNAKYPEVVESEKLFPTGSPNYGEIGNVKAGEDFTFEFTLEVKPEIELTSYDPVEIELPAEGASEEEINDQVEAIVSHYANYVDADENTALEKDGYAELATYAKKENAEEVESVKNDARFYAVGSGLFSDAFDDAIIGMKKGETRKFDLEIAEDEQSLVLSALQGQKISFEVTCNAVKVKEAPELTDEWVKENTGFGSIENLREEIKQSITDQKNDIIPRIKENVCITKLVDRVDIEPPASMCEQNESSLLQDFFMQLQAQGMSFDQYLSTAGIDSETFKNDVKKQAEDESKQHLALDAWARHFGIDASDEEITLEFEKAGVEDPSGLEKEWRQSGRLYLIREGIIRAKAMEDVMEKAKVTPFEPKSTKESEKSE